MVTRCYPRLTLMLQVLLNVTRRYPALIAKYDDVLLSARANPLRASSTIVMGSLTPISAAEKNGGRRIRVEFWGRVANRGIFRHDQNCSDSDLLN